MFSLFIVSFKEFSLPIIEQGLYMLRSPLFGMAKEEEDSALTPFTIKTTALLAYGSQLPILKVKKGRTFLTRLWRTAECLRALALANNRLKPKPQWASFLSLQICS